MNPSSTRLIFVGLIFLVFLASLFALVTFNQSQNATQERDTVLTQVALQAATLTKMQMTTAPVSTVPSNTPPPVALPPTVKQSSTPPPIAPIPTSEQSTSMAFSREIAAQAIDELQIDPELSLLLATEAMRVAETDQAKYVLRRSLMESNVRMVLREQSGSVYRAIYSPDGKYIATAGKDGNAKIWDANTGRLLATLDAQINEFSLGMFINTFVFSPDGSLLVTVGSTWGVNMWQVPDGKLVRVLSGENPPVGIVNIAFSPDRKWLMGVECHSTGGLACKMSIRVWSTETWQSVSQVDGATGLPVSVAFSPDSQLMMVATLGDDNVIQVWQVRTWKMIGEMKEHKKPIFRATFSPNSQYILSASAGEDVRLWEPRSPITYSREIIKSTQYPDIAFSPDSKYFAVVGQDGLLHIWSTGSSMESSTILAGTPLYSVAFSPDGRSVMVVGEDNTVRIWDWNSRQLSAILRGHTGGITSALYSPDGKSIITASDDGTARVWATSAQTPYVSSKPGGDIVSVEYSPDSKYILVANRSGLVQVEDALTLNPIAKLQSEFQYLRNATYSPDGQSIALASYDKNTLIWNWHTNQVIGQLPSTKPTGGVTWSPDGKFLVTADPDFTARVWSAQTGEKIVELDKHTKEVSSARFSSDGKFLVTTSYDTARVYQVSDWKMISEWSSFGDHMYTGVFSPDSQYIITGSTSQVARVWDWRKKQLVAELRAGRLRFEVSTIVFSPDGNLVVTAGAEPVLWLWDTHTWQLVTTFTGHDLPITSVGFSPDGNYLVSGGSDYLTLIHACQVCAPIQTLLDLAHQRTTRDLTCNERQTYLHQAVECPTVVPRP